MTNYSWLPSINLGNGLTGKDNNSGDGSLQYVVYILSLTGSTWTKTVITPATNANVYESSSAYYVTGAIMVPYGSTYYIEWQDTNGAQYGVGQSQDNDQDNDLLAAIEAGSGGGSGFTGPSHVTFSFVDADNNPVPYVTFCVVDVGIATTDANGTIAVGMYNQSYTAIGVPAGGTLWPVTPFTVDGTTTVPIIGTAVVTPSPTSPPGTTAPNIDGPLTLNVLSFNGLTNCLMEWRQNDTQPYIMLQIMANGTAVDLSGATVTINFVVPGQTSFAQTSDMTISGDDETLTYTRAKSDFTTQNAGRYYFVVTATWPDGSQLSAPNTAEAVLIVNSAF